MVRITILESAPPVTGFDSFWRILDRSGQPAASCGIRTILSQVDCGPFAPSGNPYRIELSAFFYDREGAYTARVNFLSSLCPPRQPVLSSPANGANHVLTNPAFSWGSADRATSYRLQISTDSSFAPPTFMDRGGIIGTFHPVSGLSNLTA